MRLIVTDWLIKPVFVALFIFVTFSAQGAAYSEGLDRRLIVGYQGWFGCPNDFDGNAEWEHWFFRGVWPQLSVDLLPSVREFKPEALCDTGIRRADGQGTVKLYSAQNPDVVATHFRWMREYAIDAAAIQRFVPELLNPVKKKRRDHVLANVRAAAEANERAFFIAYDISGANPKTVIEDIRRDWRYLVDVLHITESPAYMTDHGKPVLQLWGFGVGDRPGEPAAVKELIGDLKTGNRGLKPVTLVGGVPTFWRTLQRDSKSDQLWAEVFRSYDVISPWTVGRFADESGADAFLHDVMLPDMDEAKRMRIRYMPVVYPGFSWYNLMTARGRNELAVLNKISRRCGQFMWRQIHNAMVAGSSTIYIAMFDEVDEGTAIFPIETRQDKLPENASMVYLNEDGCSLPDDWYLRIAAAVGKAIRNGITPPPNLESVIHP